jgi:hypothetical protein
VGDDFLYPPSTHVTLIPRPHPRSFFKAIRTVERGVPILSRKRIVVTALVCHPAMMDIDATGNDVAFAGHSDGSITSFKVMNGEMLKDFKAPAVEVIDTKGCVHQ